MVRKLKLKSERFIAKDGAKFKTHAQAEAHERLYLSLDQYKRARRALRQAFAEAKLLTADGVPFVWGKHYWCVTCRLSDSPQVQEIWQYWYDGQIEYDRGREAWGIGKHVGRDHRFYDISELYSTERAAYAEVIRLHETDDQLRAEQLAELKAKWEVE